MATDYGDLQAQMARINRRVADETAAIRKNADRLSTKGLEMAMSAVVSKARAEAATLREAHLKSRVDQRKSLERRLFGLPENASPADMMVWRDAQDRAAKITTAKDALATLDRYRTLGDDTMVQAVAQVALRNGWSKSWGEVIDNWLDADTENPATAGINQTLVDKLRDIPSDAGNRIGLADGAAFAVPGPPELRSKSTRDIDQMATQNELTEP